MSLFCSKPLRASLLSQHKIKVLIKTKKIHSNLPSSTSPPVYVWPLLLLLNACLSAPVTHSISPTSRHMPFSGPFSRLKHFPSGMRRFILSHLIQVFTQISHNWHFQDYSKVQLPFPLSIPFILIIHTPAPSLKHWSSSEVLCALFICILSIFPPLECIFHRHRVCFRPFNALSTWVELSKYFLSECLIEVSYLNYTTNNAVFQLMLSIPIQE